MEIEDLASGEKIGEEIEAKKGRKPDFRVMQAVTDAEGQGKLKSVGGLWKNTSKSGNTFYTLRIGGLNLLVFPNANEGA